MRIHRPLALTAAALSIALLAPAALAQTPAPGTPTKAPFPYLQAQTYHVLDQTHNNESGYFSLAEGPDGKLYVGAARYGENSYLVELDPKSGKQRIVIDTNAVTGATGTGFASQAKIHTKNFVGPSGKVYVGSKEGYPVGAEKAKNDVSPYAGGYVMVYDPKTDKTENLGIAYPGQGLIDVIADEPRGLIYVVTCEDQHWMVYDTKNDRRFRWLGPDGFPYASTIVDAGGRANLITREYKLARWDPVANKLTEQPILVDGKPLTFVGNREERGAWIPNWAKSADGKTAYLVRMSQPEVFAIDLTGDLDKPAQARLLGKALEGPGFDCRSALSVGPDGKVYVVAALDNTTGFGSGPQLVHVARLGPTGGKSEDLGVLTVADAGYYDRAVAEATGDNRAWKHGFEKLPDGTWAPHYSTQGAIVGRDGALNVLLLYPFTVMRVEGVAKPATGDAPVAAK